MDYDACVKLLSKAVDAPSHICTSNFFIHSMYSSTTVHCNFILQLSLLHSVAVYSKWRNTLFVTYFMSYVFMLYRHVFLCFFLHSLSEAFSPYACLSKEPVRITLIPILQRLVESTRYIVYEEVSNKEILESFQSVRGESQRLLEV